MNNLIKVIFLLSLLFIQTNSLYFQIKSDRERCFIDEFSKDSVVIIKFHLYGTDMTDEESMSILISRFKID